MKLTELNFSPLADGIQLGTFDCGLPDITSFLHDDALAYQNEKMANTYLFHNETL